MGSAAPSASGLINEIFHYQPTSLILFYLVLSCLVRAQIWQGLSCSGLFWRGLSWQLSLLNSKFESSGEEKAQIVLGQPAERLCVASHCPLKNQLLLLLHEAISPHPISGTLLTQLAPTVVQARICAFHKPEPQCD